MNVTECKCTTKNCGNCNQWTTTWYLTQICQQCDEDEMTSYQPRVEENHINWIPCNELLGQQVPLERGKYQVTVEYGDHSRTTSVAWWSDFGWVRNDGDFEPINDHMTTVIAYCAFNPCYNEG